jgi:hypothetical protein
MDNTATAPRTTGRHRRFPDPLINWWEVAFMLWAAFGLAALIVMWGLTRTDYDAGQVNRDWGLIATIAWVAVLAAFSIRADRFGAPATEDAG